MPKDFGAAIQRLILNGDDIFDGDGNAEQKPLLMRSALGYRGVRGIRLRERILFIVAKECFDPVICPLDLPKARLRSLSRGDLALSQFRRQFGDGQARDSAVLRFSR